MPEPWQSMRTASSIAIRKVRVIQWQFPYWAR
jgi:hypothetical protein